jgi:uncharacterized protein (TIGR02145 family)
MKKISINWICPILLSASLLSVLLTCKKGDVIKVTPTINIAAVTNITSNSATSGGAVTSDGGTAVTSRGVCWCTDQNPTINNSKTTDGTGIGSFTSNLTGLSSYTTYHIRAYATNIAGTAYGDDATFKTLVADVDGNEYHTVTIGAQDWMVENLKTTTLNDGTVIPNVTDNAEWTKLTSPGYCWLFNDIINKEPYGALYNAYTVNTGKLCPTGWHITTETEWTTLADYLGGWDIAGGKLKESGTEHWQNPNNGATNESGFTAVGSGARDNIWGFFYGKMNEAHWWSSTRYDLDRLLLHNYCVDHEHIWGIDTGEAEPEHGFSVRCIKD